MARHTFSANALLVFLPATLAGCAEHHARSVQRGLEGDRVTVGMVRREIRKGMSGSEVIEALGSPNVVSTDENSREVWVYDKFATDVVESSGSWVIFGGGGGAGSGGAGGGALGASGSAGARSTSQRTLTVIIKFDDNKTVRDFAYRSSRF